MTCLTFCFVIDLKTAFFVFLCSLSLVPWNVLGEVSDSESNSSSSSSDSDSSEDEVFRDGYDDDLMGDAEDRARLEQMTEKEREQELFNRIEKREVLKRRWVGNKNRLKKVVLGINNFFLVVHKILQVIC